MVGHTDGIAWSFPLVRLLFRRILPHGVCCNSQVPCKEQRRASSCSTCKWARISAACHTCLSSHAWEHECPLACLYGRRKGKRPLLHNVRGSGNSCFMFGIGTAISALGASFFSVASEVLHRNTIGGWAQSKTRMQSLIKSVITPLTFTNGFSLAQHPTS